MMNNSYYEKKVHKILKTYNSILVKCRNIPISPDKNIILVDDMDSMINTQIETRKPILYFAEEHTTSFMILDHEEVYVYIIKKYDDIESKVESIIKTIESSKNSFFGDIFNFNDQLLLNNGLDNGNEVQENTSLVPIKKKSIFDFLFSYNNEKKDKRRKRKIERERREKTFG